ncbi:hypothetical protein [Lacticaseibacillus saniviri]
MTDNVNHPSQRDCQYCHNEPLQADLLQTDSDLRTIVYIGQGMLQLESATTHVGLPINYCPMCGREL